jgi:hypothetical protein
MALVTVETTGLALVSMPGLGIHGGDHPVRRDRASDPEHALVLDDVLTDHAGQQLCCRTDPLVEFAALQQGQHRHRITAAGIDQGFPSTRIVPVDLGFRGGGVVIPASHHRLQRGGQVNINNLEQDTDC